MPLPAAARDGAHDAHLAPSPTKAAPKSVEKAKVAKMVKVVKASPKVATRAKVVEKAQPKPTAKEVSTSLLLVLYSRYRS